MILLFGFAQGAPQPQDLVTLQWVIITALVSVVLILFRQWRKTEEECAETRTALLEKTLAGLAETREVIQGMASALEAYQDQLSVLQEIDALRREIRHGSDKPA